MREILGGPSACLLYFNRYNALQHNGRVRLVASHAPLRVSPVADRGPKGASRKTSPKDRLRVGPSLPVSECLSGSPLYGSFPDCAVCFRPKGLCCIAATLTRSFR